MHNKPQKIAYEYCDIASAFESFCAKHELIENNFKKFARSDAYGYLTVLPNDLGYFEFKVALELS